MEQYLKLFVDCFLASGLVPVGGEDILSLMLVYGSYPKLLILLVAVAGALSSFALCYTLGLGIKYILHPRMEDESHHKTTYQRISDFLNRYWVLCGLAGLIQLAGGAFSTMAGIFHVRFSRFLVAVTIAKTLYYVVWIYR